MFELLTSKPCPWMCKHVCTGEIGAYTEGETSPEHQKTKVFVVSPLAFSVPVIQITFDLEVLTSEAHLFICLSELGLSF